MKKIFYTIFFVTVFSALAKAAVVNCTVFDTSETFFNYVGGPIDLSQSLSYYPIGMAGQDLTVHLRTDAVGNLLLVVDKYSNGLVKGDITTTGSQSNVKADYVTKSFGIISVNCIATGTPNLSWGG